MMENDGKSDSPPPRMMEIPSFVFLFFFCAFPNKQSRDQADVDGPVDDSRPFVRIEDQSEVLHLKHIFISFHFSHLRTACGTISTENRKCFRDLHLNLYTTHQL